VDSELGDILLRLARGAIARRLGQVAQDAPHHEALDRPGATFVTLTRDGELRGCIGTLEAHRPLGEDVRENAVAAAFRDPRFPPLTEEELPATRVEVSLLTAPQTLTFAGEADALAQLRPQVDGVVLMHDCHRATFLPQVWDSLPEPRQFLAQLKRKAGLPPDFWDDAMTLARYQVTKWKEPAPWAA
jgi:AmmeMemoRadiSam system protein A